MKFWGEFSYFLTTCGFKYSIENALTHRSDWVESSSWENFVRPNKKKKEFIQSFKLLIQ